MCDWMMGKTTRSNGQRGKRSVEVKHKGREGQVVEGGEAVEGGEVELPDDWDIVDSICRVLGKLGPRTIGPNLPGTICPAGGSLGTWQVLPGRAAAAEEAPPAALPRHLLPPPLLTNWSMFSDR